MKILIFGGTGLIGKAIMKAAAETHRIISIASSSGDIQADYTNPASLDNVFEETGPVDAIIAAVGRDTVLRPFAETTPEDFRYGFERKIMGQIHLVTHGLAHISDNGSIVLSSGYLGENPKPESVPTTLFDAAIDAYVKSTAPLLPRGIRINSVSPSHVIEDIEHAPGSKKVSPDHAAQAYLRCVENDFSGTIQRVWND